MAPEPVKPGRSFAGQSILLVTGRLAEPALRKMVPQLEDQFKVQLSIQVLPITVAALMSPEWIARHLQVPESCHVVLLPGYCAKDQTELVSLEQSVGLPVLLGPRDMRRLPEFFGGKLTRPILQEYSIEIIAEINHAPRLTMQQLLDQADALHQAGADVIDVGCQPGTTWNQVGLAVRELTARGLAVSIDSLNPNEIGPAVENGASLVLSVNSSNREAAVDWGCPVVAIPDDPANWRQVGETVDFLAHKNISFRIDPIIEPIGFGFAASLLRYMQARKRWPSAEMMMGIGNLTELTDVDSAGINFLLLAICQELEIHSVLTTQVINWARSSVRECDIARRIVHHSLVEGVPPKNLSSDLVCLRDARLLKTGTADLNELARGIKDNNYRIVADQDKIHLLGSTRRWEHADAFELFHQLMESQPTNVDPSHAFYLGYEMCKATIANQLGKNYEQDEALDWGHLTVHEISHRRLKRHSEKKPELPLNND